MPTDPSSFIIPAAPVVPDRTDRSTFPTRAYNWYVWMHDSLYANMNSLASTTYSNAVEANAAAVGKSFAQYKGIYAGGTTYALADIVYVSGSGYYVSNVNSNTGNAPASSPTQWASLGGAQRSGMTVVGNASATLVAGSNQVQKFAPTSPGLFCKLPDATTVSTIAQQPYFIVPNEGTCDLAIKDSTGVTRGFVPPGAVSEVSIFDNSTAAGGWGVSSCNLFGITASLENPTGAYGASASAALNAVVVLPLDSTRTLISWNYVSSSGANAVVGVVFDSSQAVGSQWGTPTTLIAGSSNNFTTHKLSLLTTNVVVMIIGVNSGPNGTAKGTPLSISGTTITVGTAASASVSGTASKTCDPVVVGTAVFIAWTVSATLNLVGFTVSANVATAGSVTVLAASGATSTDTYDLYSGGGSILVALYHNATANVYSGTPYTCTGSSLAAGTTSNSPAQYLSFDRIKTIQVSASSWAAIGLDLTAGTRLTYFSLSGTTMTSAQGFPHATLVPATLAGHDMQVCNGKLVWMGVDATPLGAITVFTFGAGATISATNQTVISTIMPTGYATPTVVPISSGSVIRALLPGTSSIRMFTIDCTSTPVVTHRHLYGGQDLSTPNQAGAKGKRDPKTMLSSGNAAAAIPIWVSGAYNKRNTSLVLAPTREWEFIQDLPECGSFADIGNSGAESWLMADFAAAQGNTGLYLQRVEVAQP